MTLLEKAKLIIQLEKQVQRAAKSGDFSANAARAGEHFILLSKSLAKDVLKVVETPTNTPVSHVIQ